MWVLGQQLQVLCNQVRYARRLTFELIVTWCVHENPALYGLLYDGTYGMVSRVGMSVSMLSPFILFTISTMHPSGS